MDNNNKGLKRWNPAITCHLPIYQWPTSWCLYRLAIFFQSIPTQRVLPYTFWSKGTSFQLGIYSAQVSQHIMLSLNLKRSCLGWVWCAGTESILSHLIAMLTLLLLSGIQTRSRSMLYPFMKEYMTVVANTASNACVSTRLLRFTCTMSLKHRCASRKQSG